MITVCYGTQQVQVAEGSTLAELAAGLSLPRRPLAAIVNGRLHEMDYPLFSNSRLEWLDQNTDLGWRIYNRSLLFLLQLAVQELFPGRTLHCSHTVSERLFCWLEDEASDRVSPQDVAAIEQRLRDYVAQDLPISKQRLSTADAAAFFRAQGREEKAAILEEQGGESICLYQAGMLQDYFFGEMAVSAGYMPEFSITPQENGFLLQLPTRIYLAAKDERPFMPKELRTILDDYQEWSSVMGLTTVSDLNAVVRQGKNETGMDAFSELVLVAEALYERNLHRIADEIFADFPEVRLVLLAGPSSSGKTTSTRRLAIQFRALGLRPVMISMDDYYVDRELTPKDENGKYDFESIHALDLELFHRNMEDLLAGKEAALPLFDFKTGKSIKNHRKLRLEDDQILLVEGIHALNESLSSGIPHRNKRKVFISPLTQLKLDECNSISVNDNRLLRRMVRDMQFRALSPSFTLSHWQDVRRGEYRNIYPYRQDADFFLNSALVYELPVLRPLVESALMEIEPEDPNYMQARRLLSLVRSFAPAPCSAVPDSSVLQEFLGNSIFEA